MMRPLSVAYADKIAEAIIDRFSSGEVRFRVPVRKRIQERDGSDAAGNPPAAD